MDLRRKYDQAIQTAKSLHMEGSALERDGKLHFVGTVHSDDEKNRIWNALKTVPDWKNDVVADIKVVASSIATGVPSAPASSSPTSRGTRTYTVQAGDTLGTIAKARLGNANDYNRIFEANRDQLSDPDKIKPGQVLRIPE